MDRFRKVIDELVDKVKEAIQGEPKSPVEILLDQYLSLDEDLVSFSPKNCTAVAVPTAALNDLAARTRNIVDYPFIMERVWEILVDYQHDPALMKKALNVLLYVLINGATQVLKDSQDSPRMTFIESLAHDYNRYEYEQYKFSQHLDVGAGVRKTAAEILHLLTNERELFHARRQAEKLHEKLTDRGLRSANSFSSREISVSATDSLRPPRYTDNASASSTDDIGLKIVTHPDELFDEPAISRSASERLPPRSELVFGNLNADHEKDSHADRPVTTRGHSRREKVAQKSRDVEQAQPLPPQRARAQTTESFDLLGLETLDLHDAVPPLQPPPRSIPRTQSYRLPPSQLTATI